MNKVQHKMLRWTRFNANAETSRLPLTANELLATLEQVQKSYFQTETQKNPEGATACSDLVLWEHRLPHSRIPAPRVQNPRFWSVWRFYTGKPTSETCFSRKTGSSYTQSVPTWSTEASGARYWLMWKSDRMEGDGGTSNYVLRWTDS